MPSICVATKSAGLCTVVGAVDVATADADGATSGGETGFTGSLFGAVSAFAVAEGAGLFLPATLADVGGSGIADAEGITEAIGAISVEADGIGAADVSGLALWGALLDGAFVA